jgi:hypothetical protein
MKLSIETSEPLLRPIVHLPSQHLSLRINLILKKEQREAGVNYFQRVDQMQDHNKACLSTSQLDVLDSTHAVVQYSPGLLSAINSVLASEVVPCH